MLIRLDFHDGQHVDRDADDGRDDNFHLSSQTVKVGETVKEGDEIGKAGDTGVGGTHLHTATSYPQGKAPEGSEDTIDAYGRTYGDPKDL